MSLLSIWPKALRHCALTITALLDAVNLAAQEIRSAKNARKALLVISDGFENHSRYTLTETKQLLAEMGFPIYAIRFYDPPYWQGRYAAQRHDPQFLTFLSSPTGGRNFVVTDPKKLASIAELVSSEIRSEYVLGYVPSNRQADGKFRRVRVTVSPSPAKSSTSLLARVITLRPNETVACE